MQVVEMPINEIIPYERNPRRNEEAVEKVANSIKQFGFRQPILLDKDNVIICGHTRLMAARALGLDKCPCIVNPDLTEKQVKALRIADNKTGEIADWDFVRLADEIDFDMDWTDLGFDNNELEGLANFRDELNALDTTLGNNVIPSDDESEDYSGDVPSFGDGFSNTHDSTFSGNVDEDYHDDNTSQGFFKPNFTPGESSYSVSTEDVNKKRQELHHAFDADKIVLDKYKVVCPHCGKEFEVRGRV